MFVCLSPIYANGQSKDELQALQKQIKQKQQHVAQQLAKAKSLQSDLKQIELKIAKAATALNATEQELKDNQQEQKKLKKRQSDIQQKLAQQQDVLARQIRSAFMTGNHDYAKMLLNQENPGKFERTITYYQYLNEARRELIDEFLLLGKELTQVNLTLIEKQDSLQNLLDRQQAQQATLNQGQKSRKQTLSKLQSAIESDAAKIEELQTNHFFYDHDCLCIHQCFTLYRGGTSPSRRENPLEVIPLSTRHRIAVFHSHDDVYAGFME